MTAALEYGLSIDNPPAMPVLAPGERLICLWPGCFYPIDPVAWPYHPSHDMDPVAWEEFDRELQAAESRAEARHDAETRRLLAEFNKPKSKPSARPAPVKKKPPRQQPVLPRSSR